MKRRAFSLLLSLTLLLSLALPATTAYAEDGSNNKGMEISKTATANKDGSYTITLEAYATGSKVISEITKDVPTDIVLVLDQSGSMDDPFSRTTEDSWVSYGKQKNSDNYDIRMNSESWYATENLYHKLADGSYVEVSVDRTSEAVQDYVVWSNARNSSCYNSYYTIYTNTEEGYKEVTVNRSGRIGNRRNYTYVYTLNDGTTVTRTSTGDNGNPPYTICRVQDTYEYTYEYYYTVNGVRTTIGEQSKGEDTVFDVEFYKKVSAGTSITALEALQNAVRNFAGAVENKAAGKDGVLGTDDDINHRIAVVGYASRADSNNPWINTELFIGANQHNYNVDAKNYYNQAFQNMNTPEGQANIQASIGALDANGATYTDYGMEMANGILDAYPLTNNEQRNRVIILFTDGFPGRNTDNFNTTAANTAISHANTAKGNGTTVYTVGIFSGADATSAGNVNGNNTQKANWFMQQVSSNNGTPQSPSYYLSAADAGSLNNIFQQISDQIETGGSSSTLTSDAVVKDIISPAFTLPANATADSITLETYRCTGVDGNGNYTWLNNNSTKGATATIGSTDTADATTTNNQVSVTGFDFAENWVGTETSAEGTTTYRGNKLVIKFNVTPRPGFLGGNGVDTNTSAGVYENEDATDPVLTFPKPDVNVPLAEPTVNVPDANVYLGAYYSQTVPEDAVKMGATVTIAGYDIDFSKADDPDHPYGLEPWQVEYVNISISATTEGNGGSFENIQEDITYTVTVTVSPKKPRPSGDETATDTGEGTIHVFKPQLTYQDSQVWYGGDAPTDFSSNLTEETWVNSDGSKKHDDEGVQMLNAKPELTLSYTPEAGKITTDGKVNTKQDIGVNATVKIGENDVLAHTTFKHTSCGENCSWNIENPNGSPAFLLHVNTCQLTINKSGGASDEPYVFTVYKDGVEYSEVTIVGNTSETIYELPVGTYTIKEDTGWSWRYNADNGSRAALSAANHNGSITCTNSSNDKIYWLNGFSQVVRNIFDISH